MVALVDVQIAAVFEQRIQLEIPVIQRFTHQEVTAAVGTATPLFQHINVTIAVAIKIVRCIA